jgi:hypothetical protein
VDKVPELPRTRRRPQPQTRIARLKLEAQLFRPRLVRLNIRFTPGELQRIDEERRVPSYGAIPSRAAMIRQLISEAIVFRRVNRSPPRPVKGVPFPLSLDWPQKP